MIAIAVITATRPAAAQTPPCEPAAILDGDPSVVEPIAAGLAARGIARASAGGAGGECPAMVVQVARTEGGLDVAVQDGNGRMERRVVSTDDIACAWIESLVRTDLDAPLLAERAPPAVAVAAPMSPPSDAVAVEVDSERVVRPGAAARPLRWSVSVGADSAVADDRSSWRAVTVGGCAELGPACVGASARYARNGGWTLNGGFTYSDRSAIDVTIAARVPVTLGAARVVPSAGLGWGRFSSTFREPLPPIAPPEPGPDGTTCMEDPALCEEPYYTSMTERSRGLRLEGGLSVEVPLTSWLAVELGAMVSWSPSAHVEPFMPEWTLMDPGVDPTDPYDQDLFGMPGEPSRFVRAGVGLRVTP